MTGTAQFRILVTASRSWRNWGKLARVLDEAADGIDPGRIVLVHGGAPGGDRMAGRYGKQAGWTVEVHDADWEAPCRPECRPGHRRKRGDGTEFCPAAGNYRNALMVSLGADTLVALLMPCADLKCRRPQPHDSHGACDCAEGARLAGIPVRTVRP